MSAPLRHKLTVHVVPLQKSTQAKEAMVKEGVEEGATAEGPMVEGASEERVTEEKATVKEAMVQGATEEGATEEGATNREGNPGQEGSGEVEETDSSEPLVIKVQSSAVYKSLPFLLAQWFRCIK